MSHPQLLVSISWLQQCLGSLHICREKHQQCHRKQTMLHHLQFQEARGGQREAMKLDETKCCFAPFIGILEEYCVVMVDYLH